MAKRKVFIGSNFGGLNFYNEDGTPMEITPYVTLHSREKGEYYVADHVGGNEDGVSIDAVFTAQVTERMTPGLYALEVYNSSDMEAMIYYEDEFAIAIVVSATPGQILNG